MMKSFLLSACMVLGVGMLSFAQEPDSVRWDGNIDFHGASNHEYGGKVKVRSSGSRLRTVTDVDWGFIKNNELHITRKESRQSGTHELDSLPKTKSDMKATASISAEYDITSEDMVYASLSHHTAYGWSLIDGMVFPNIGVRRDLTNEEYNERNLDLGLGYKRKLSSPGSLDFKLGGQIFSSRDSIHHENSSYNPEDIEADTYTQYLRHLKNKKGNEIRFGGYYETPAFLDVENLHVTGHIGYVRNAVKDVQDSYYFDRITGEWTYLPVLDVYYDFAGHLADLSLDASYEYGRFAVSAFMDAQCYYRKLDEDSPVVEYENKPDTMRFSLVGNAKISYSFNEKNKLYLTYKRSISRPDYTQLTSYFQISDNLQEIVYGNRGLRNIGTDKLELTYSHSGKRFGMDLCAGYRVTDGGIEKVLRKVDESIGYSEYYWMNTKTERDITGNFDFFWKGEILRVSLKTYTGYKIISTNSGSPVKAFRYGADGDVAVNLPRDWSISGSFVYNSSDRKSYSKMDQYVSSSVGVSKIIAKRYKLSLALKDIFDHPMMTYSWDASSDSYEDAKERTMKTDYLNRRAVVAGFSFVF